MSKPKKIYSSSSEEEDDEDNYMPRSNYQKSATFNFKVFPQYSFNGFGFGRGLHDQ